MSKKLSLEEIIRLKTPKDHKLPTTRREFLKYGIIPFAGYALAPSFLGQILFQNVAKAAGVNPQEAPLCGASGESGYLPFLVFDLEGGAGLPGNFLVGKTGGPSDLIKDYSTLGWNPRNSGAIDERFGLPMAGNNVSRMLAGILQTAKPENLAKLRMGSFLHFSQDDTSVNRTSALTLVARAGLKGKFIENGVGSRNTLSGGKSDEPLREAMLKPLFVQNSLDIQNSISHGPAFDQMSDQDIKRISESIYQMSTEQISQFQSLPEARKLQQIAECGYKPTLGYGKVIQGLNPQTDQNAQQVYQLGGNATDQNSVFGSIVYNVLQGNTGPGVVSFGDFDYHNKGQQVADAKDQEAGQQIGRAVELAARLNKPLFFQIITDGGVSANPGTRDWQSDSNQRSMTIIGFFDPKGAPKQRRIQIGEYTDGGVVNQDILIGGKAMFQGESAPVNVANMVLANYMSACGKLGEFDKVAQTAIRNSELDSIIIFDKA